MHCKHMMKKDQSAVVTKPLSLSFTSVDSPAHTLRRATMGSPDSLTTKHRSLMGWVGEKSGPCIQSENRTRQHAQPTLLSVAWERIQVLNRETRGRVQPVAIWRTADSKETTPTFSTSPWNEALKAVLLQPYDSPTQFPKASRVGVWEGGVGMGVPCLDDRQGGVTLEGGWQTH